MKMYKSGNNSLKINGIQYPLGEEIPKEIVDNLTPDRKINLISMLRMVISKPLKYLMKYKKDGNRIP